MNGTKEVAEPLGKRLLRLMNTQLPEIVRKEHSDGTHVHLYGTGAYWVAFEQSAVLSNCVRKEILKTNFCP